MNKLWVESYRPKTISDYVFRDEDQRTQVESWVRSGSIPHLLLSGSPGVGKTTIAKVLINELNIEELDVLTANGSKEGRKIEWIDRLIAFCSTMPFGDFKVVLIDEADYMNKESVQPALRNLMEEYSDTVRFILTCNYPNKIIPALHSRFQGFHIEKIDHTEFTSRVATILITEGVDVDIETLDSYVKATYPDLRKCINLVQQNTIDGVLVEPGKGDKSVDDFLLTAVDLFKKGKVLDARKVLCENVNQDEVEDIYRWMYDNLDLWSNTQEGKDQAILAIAKGLRNVPMVADQEINLAATLVELCMIG